MNLPQQLLARDIYEGKGNKSKNELLGLTQDTKLLQQKKQSTKLKNDVILKREINYWDFINIKSLSSAEN